MDFDSNHVYDRDGTRPVAPRPLDGQPAPMPAIDDDTLARAILTFCIDGADALLFATIKGAGSAVEALRLIAASGQGARQRGRLDKAFATGTARWGRSVNARGMDSFHHALERWKGRLAQLPCKDADGLRAWLSMDGAQWIIGPSSPCWPRQLDDLSIRKNWASPLCLWGFGEPQALVSCSHPLAVVGSRGVDEYGRYVARTIAKKASQQGHLVVSGGAFGADAAAHWGALDTMSMLGPDEAGRTVAVFAGGLNHIGPERNRRLFERIVAHHGALVSELCPGTIPEARRFLLRNRIIAALASTVVVAQARSRSGALNTANWAADLGREVYAAPGNINRPGNTGCNWLIRDHRASILTSVNAIDEICHAAHPPADGVDADADGDGTDVGADTNTNTGANTRPAGGTADDDDTVNKANGPRTEAIATRAETGSSRQAGNTHETQGTQATQIAIDLPRRGKTHIPSTVQRSGQGQTSTATATGTGPTADPTTDPHKATVTDQSASTRSPGTRKSGAGDAAGFIGKDEPSPKQREVLTAVRRCRRQGMPATREAILATLRGTTSGKTRKNESQTARSPSNGSRSSGPRPSKPEPGKPRTGKPQPGKPQPGKARANDPQADGLRTAKPQTDRLQASRIQTDQSSATRNPWNVGALEAALGEMELLGMVRLKSGTVSIATGSG